jgi:hypothetical protein
MNMQKRITVVKMGAGKNPNTQMPCCLGASLAKVK